MITATDGSVSSCTTSLAFHAASLHVCVVIYFVKCMCCTYPDTFFRSVVVLVIFLIINFRFMASRFRSLCDVVDLELRFSNSIARASS